MVKRIAAIIFIFMCTAMAWVILGGTIIARTESRDSSLRGQVQSIWGAPHTQVPPTAVWSRVEKREVEATENGKKIMRTEDVTVSDKLPLESSRIDTALDLEHRQKGLLWYSTYKVAFAGEYGFRNNTDQQQVVTFKLPFPTTSAIYDDLVLTLNGAPFSSSSMQSDSVSGTALVPAGGTANLKVGYRSQGVDRWNYSLGGEGVSQVRDFNLKMTTNFRDIDFPENTLAPSEKKETASGWELTWEYKNLISGFQIGMDLPDKLQPGPLAGQISFFAPVSLFFFFFLMFIITTLRGIELHPMNYFFLAAAFFAFHLLLAYLVDHISIHAAFVISSVVSIFLVISYLRLVVGMRFAAVEAGLAQLVYLVLFSYAFFLKGFTGLAVTIGSIITLFVVMQMTGRIRWAEKFATVKT